MERIVLRHLSGSKANQVEEFPLVHIKELILGRDPSATVKYDPDRDDLVGRQHARITQDPSDQSQFTLTDLNSRNGTFVNKQRIAGSTKIGPGDVVQLGPGGPEFQFDLEPRPQNTAKTTRVAPALSGGPPPTRSAPTGGPPPFASSPSGAAAGNSSSSSASSSGAPGSVGKATVERMISHNIAETKKSESRKFLVIGGAALIAVLLLFGTVAGFLVWRNRSAENRAATEISNLKKGIDADKERAGMRPTDIVKQYGGAVVKIDVVWKLVSEQGNGLVYHQYVPYTDSSGAQRKVARYVRLPNGKIEPYLDYSPSPINYAIGGAHSGTGFAVSSDGFILTNRHVAAAWETAFDFPPQASPGVILGPDGKVIEVIQQAPIDWVPAKSKQDRVSYDGRNDRLDVTFPKSDRRLAAKLSSISPRHDVAMVKIDSPGTVPKVELFDNYDAIQPGDMAVVLGYPGVSPPVFGIVKSQDMFNREAQLTEIPDPTVTVTNIGRVLRGQENLNERTIVYSQSGDIYQLSTSATGSGNSGGPVFDDRGRVVGIFYAGRSAANAAVTFAVPIRYGHELMGVGAPK